MVLYVEMSCCTAPAREMRYDQQLEMQDSRDPLTGDILHADTFLWLHIFVYGNCTHKTPHTYIHMYIHTCLHTYLHT